MYTGLHFIHAGGSKERRREEVGGRKEGGREGGREDREGARYSTSPL